MGNDNDTVVCNSILSVIVNRGSKLNRTMDDKQEEYGSIT